MPVQDLECKEATQRRLIQSWNTENKGRDYCTSWSLERLVKVRSWRVFYAMLKILDFTWNTGKGIREWGLLNNQIFIFKGSLTESLDWGRVKLNVGNLPEGNASGLADRYGRVGRRKARSLRAIGRYN